MEINTPASPPIHLYIGTPCYGGQATSAYFNSLLKLEDASARLKVNMTVLTLWGDALITRARQNIAACFLDDVSATHLLFIDSDIGFEPSQVFRLIQFNKDVIAALYPLKHYDWDKMKTRPKEGRTVLESAYLSYAVKGEDWNLDPQGFGKVAYAGAGFLMIQRRALLAMIARYPHLRYAGGNHPQDPLRNSQNRYAFFNCQLDEKTGRFLSDDETFCRLWTDMGGEIWADFQSRLDHVGTEVFRGSPVADKGVQ